MNSLIFSDSKPLFWQHPRFMKSKSKQTLTCFFGFDIFQTFTLPSPPPVMILWPSDVTFTAVTSLEWARVISHASLPDWGLKAFTVLSLQPKERNVYIA